MNHPPGGATIFGEVFLSNSVPFSALLDAAPDAMLIVDASGNVTHANAQAERLYGYGRAEIVGRPVELLIPERFRALHPAYREAYFASPRPRRMGSLGVALYGRRKDGTEFPAEVSLSPLDTDAGPLVIAAIRDGTERQETEARFRRLLDEGARSEERFRRLLEVAPDAMVIVDRDGRIVLVNDQVETIFCHPKQELLGKPVEILIPERYRGAHPGHRLGYFAVPRTRPMGAGGLALFGLRRDGTEFPAEISLGPLETQEGAFAIAAVRDISERRKAEEERAKLAQAQEAIRLRDEFLSVASHELRTPLAAVQMQLEALGRSIQTKAPGEVLQRLPAQHGRIRRAIARLTTLVEQLLDLSRITAGRLTLHREDADLVAIARGVIELFQEEAQRAGSTLTLEAPPALAVSCDPLRTEQVLTNLVSNAVKYGEGKPVELRVEPAGGGGVRVSVRDHGIGIAPESQARIFERFERLVPSRHYSGIGLGLWIVRQIVEAHGGTIRVWSQPAAGSLFTVELPTRAGVQAPVPGDGIGAPAKLVLLVDDDPLIRDTFRDVLESEGYEVQTAQHGLDALEKLRAGARPRVILLDLMMPVMDGWSFRAEQQRDPSIAGIPVVVVSAVSDLGTRAGTLKAAALLAKPPEMDALVRLLDSLAVARS